MAKAGMRRPSPKDPHGTESNRKLNIPKNDAEPVPEIQGKAKNSHKKANAINNDTVNPQRNSYNKGAPHNKNK